jgi:hypothetical protein
MRSAFLGLKGLSTFLSPYDFFQKFLNPTHIFSHIHLLVGRVDQLSQLDSLVSSAKHRVALVRGPGGIGKSKLLHAFGEEFAIRHPGVLLRLAADGVPITPESLDELANSPLVVVVEDAHRRDRNELAILFAIAHQRKQPFRLILTLRPNGYDGVRSRLIQSGFDTSEIIAPIELRALSVREVKELASNVLGKNYSRLVDRLAEASKDCPLVTVIGGRLLVEKAVEPELLERQSEFQEAVLSKFQDEIIGKVSEQIEPRFVSQR